MKNPNQIANRFREILLDGKWIANTNYKDQLTQTTWQQAIHKIGTLNTIAALTFHVNYYIGGVLNVFEGGNLEIRDKYSFDCPPISSKEEWENLQNNLFTNSEEFAKRIEALSEEKLDDPFVDEKYGTYRRNIEGIIEHSYYHLGQITLIRKMLLELL
ncbi:MAG: DUF1572 domain-containing protein [Chitinophagales bacterium]